MSGNRIIDNLITHDNLFQKEVLSCLEIEDLKTLSLVDKNRCVLFQPAYKLSYLAQSIVDGDVKRTIKILAKHPEFLTAYIPMSIMSLNGTVFNNTTPLKLILSHQDEEMVGIARFSLKRTRHYQAAAQQIKAFNILPTGQLFNYDNLINAITNDSFIDGKPNDFTQQEVIKLREYFQPNLHNHIENYIHFLKTIKTQLSKWNTQQDKVKLDFLFVIGSYQVRTFPVCLIQTILSGLHLMVPSGIRGKDELIQFRSQTNKLVTWDLSNQFFYPLDANESLRLGYECGIYDATVGYCPPPYGTFVTEMPGFFYLPYSNGVLGIDYEIKAYELLLAKKKKAINGLIEEVEEKAENTNSNSCSMQ